jgi:predicted ribosome quality control (RQC) complex YloA/Tae2 family protein
MRTELSSLDIYFLVKEFSEIVGGKINKVYQKEDIFWLQIYKRGKKYLKVTLPSLIFLSEEKEELPESGKFALSLRKHLVNARIMNISLKGFERIIEIELEARAGYRLYFELFRPGNAILCDKNNKVVLAYRYKGFGSRLIRPGIEYEYPVREYNFLELSEGKLAKLLESSDKASVVVTLAVDLGLGGQYAEELCSIAGIDGKKQKLETREIKRLMDAVSMLKEREIRPTVYYDEGNVVDITPFKLITRKEKAEEGNSFNHALDSFFTVKTKKEVRKEKLSKFEKEKNRLERIISSQQSQIKGLESSAEENQKKGELIYEKYALMSGILDDLNKASKKYSWKEIKEKLKDHKLVKEINEKEKKITIELNKEFK